MSSARLICSLLAAHACANAGIVYTNFGPLDEFSIASLGLVGSIPGIPGATYLREATPFIPTYDARLDTIRLALSIVEGPVGDIRVHLATGFPAPAANFDARLNLPVWTGQPTVIETFLVQGLTHTPSIFTVTSIVHPLMRAGQEYHVIAEAVDPSVFGGWHHSTQRTGWIWHDVPSRLGWEAVAAELLTSEITGTQVTAVAAPEAGTGMLGLLAAAAVGLQRCHRGPSSSRAAD